MGQTDKLDAPPSWRSSKLKKPLVIAGLVLFFGFDDLVLIVLFFKIGFPRLATLAWAAIALAVTLLNVGLALAVYKVIMSRPSTGVEGLVGLTGTVVSSSGQRGRVFVRGEDWNAEFLGDAIAGDEIRVVCVKGLTLGVERTRGRNEGDASEV
jgi:membrane protein implicated in regulation of membrane protease activity